MKFYELIKKNLNIPNSEISRGVQNQITILPALADEDTGLKLELLNKAGIPIFTYTGLRILEFRYNDIEEVLSKNPNELEKYRNNPQELVKELRKKEIHEIGSSLDNDLIGGM